MTIEIQFYFTRCWSLNHLVSQYPVAGFCYTKTKQQMVFQCEGGRSLPQPLFLGAHLNAGTRAQGFKQLAMGKFSRWHSNVVRCCLHFPTAIPQQKKIVNCPRQGSRPWMDPSDLVPPRALRQDQLYQLCKKSTKWGLLLALPVILTPRWCGRTSALSRFLLACVFCFS